MPDIKTIILLALLAVTSCNWLIMQERLLKCGAEREVMSEQIAELSKPAKNPREIKPIIEWKEREKVVVRNVVQKDESCAAELDSYKRLINAF